MLCYETNNRMKAIKAKNLWEKYLGKEFDIKVNDASTLMLVKSDNRWRVIDLASPYFPALLEEFLDEMRTNFKEQEEK